VRALLKEGESANTQRSYASALRYWAAWFRLRYRSPLTLPVPVPAVLQFLVDHVERMADDGGLLHDLPPAIDQALVDGGFKGAFGAPALNTVLSKAHAQTYLYRLTHSKTDQAGIEHNPDADKPLLGPAAEALTAWLQVSGVTSGAIFRRIRKTKAVEPLSGQAVWLVVKRRTALAGLEDDFGAHSLRSGFVTEAGRQNVPMKETMAMTGHRSLQTFLKYFQTGAVQQTRAATLLKDSADK
jgi:Phage integrase family